MAHQKLKIVAKFLLKDGWGNAYTLLVRVAEDQSIRYSLSGTISRIAMCLSNIQTQKPFPDLMLDYKNVDRMLCDVVLILRDSTYNTIEFKSYE